MDWTSSFFNGDGCKLAKPCFSRDHRPDKRQVKIGLAMTAAKCIPFHFSVEEGNLVDTKQFKRDYLAIESRLPENALITFDRGAKSKGNWELIRNGGRDYLSAINDTTELREKIRRIDKTRCWSCLAIKVAIEYLHGGRSAARYTSTSTLTNERQRKRRREGMGK